MSVLTDRVSVKTRGDSDIEQAYHDGNGHSHVRASLLGPSVTVPFEDGKLLTGTWQQIVLVDFDNRPRQRQIVVQLTGERT